MTAEQPIDLRFGAIAVLKQFITKEQLRQALRVQQLAQEKGGEPIPIGKVLITMKLLDAAQVAAVLAIQKELAQAGQPGDAVARLLASQAAEQAIEPAVAENQSVGPAPENTADHPAEPAGAATDPVADNDDPGLVLEVSPDILAATIRRQSIPGRQPSVEDVLRMLDGAGITHGVIDIWRIRAFLQPDTDPSEELVVARGTPAVAGTPGKLTLFFDNNYLKAGTIREDGTMDWKDRGAIPHIHEGEVLARIEDGTEGTPGISICGLPIAPAPVPRPKLRVTKNAALEDEGRQVTAKTGGMPRLIGNDLFDVLQTLVIEENVGLETGHVTFDGHVDVGGAVERGFCVTAKSLRAREIEAAEINVAQDIYVAEGIVGAKIRCGGSIRASHVHHAVLQVDSDLVVEKEIIASNVETDGWCIIGGGKILASDIVAKKGIQAGDIGVDAARPNRLTVGIDSGLERKTRDLKERIKAAHAELKETEDKIADTSQRLDRLATDLGAAAQNQDRCMVQIRRLEEKMEAVGPNADNAQKARLEEAIGQLKQQQAGIDESVDRLMSEDDCLRQQSSELEAAKRQLQADARHCGEQLEALAAQARRDNYQAVIKVNNKILSGTRITMAHDTMTLKEDMGRIRIGERMVTTEAGSAHWTICFSPMR